MKQKIVGIAILAMSVILTGCGEKAVTEQPVEEVIEQVEITPLADEQIKQDLNKDCYEEFEIKSRTSEKKTDSVEIAYKGGNITGAMPQSITKTVEYMYDLDAGKWGPATSKCTAWKVEHKKLGGTAWKLSTEDGDVYFRFRENIEFFRATINQNGDDEAFAEFDTSIMGARAIVKDSEMTLDRFQIISGTITDEGVVNIKMLLDDGEAEYTLSDFEKIEKESLPFDEEDFKIASDAR